MGALAGHHGLLRRRAGHRAAGRPAAHRRVQDLVDRRFNRRRYDAARTVAGFARRFRDQVDLDALRDELLGVVDQTVQPARASVWLRSPAGSPASSGQEPLGG